MNWSGEKSLKQYRCRVEEFLKGGREREKMDGMQNFN